MVTSVAPSPHMQQHNTVKHFIRVYFCSRAASLEAGGADLAYLSGSHPNPAEI